jgi:hypothetical protein
MTVPEILQILSIALEAGAVILAVVIAVKKKLLAGWLFAFTFVIYVVYDSARLTGTNLPGVSLQVAFIIASLSALGALWLLFRKT